MMIIIITGLNSKPITNSLSKQTWQVDMDNWLMVDNSGRHTERRCAAFGTDISSSTLMRVLTVNDEFTSSRLLVTAITNTWQSSASCHGNKINCNDDTSITDTAQKLTSSLTDSVISFDIHKRSMQKNICELAEWNFARWPLTNIVKVFINMHNSTPHSAQTCSLNVTNWTLNYAIQAMISPQTQHPTSFKKNL